MTQATARWTDVRNPGGSGKRWMPLAYLFAVAGMFGTLPVFQVNQLVQITRDALAIPAGITSAENHFTFDLIMGLVLSVSLFAVAVGKVRRVRLSPAVSCRSWCCFML